MPDDIGWAVDKVSGAIGAHTCTVWVDDGKARNCFAKRAPPLWKRRQNGTTPKLAICGETTPIGAAHQLGNRVG